jgi:DNA-binding PadR family transcriptional regulator
MLVKGWIEKQMDAKAGARYRITPAGEAALKAKIPDVHRIRKPKAEQAELGLKAKK